MLDNMQPQRGRCGLYAPDEVAEKIRSGRPLVIAGDWKLLTSLPQGEWIGGVSTHFQTLSGCLRTDEKAFVIDLSTVVNSYRLGVYPDFAVESVYDEMPSNGFTFMVLPGFSPVHRLFGSQFAAKRPGVVTPLVGFVSGTDVGTPQMQEPFVIDGMRGTIYTDSGVALHCKLADWQHARVEIINPFSPDEQGDAIMFPTSSLVVRECCVNGEQRNFADYLREQEIPAGLPLVGCVQGMMQNVMVVYPLGRTSVAVASPVLPSIEYHFARRSDMSSARYSEVSGWASQTVVASVHGNGNYKLMAGMESGVERFAGPFALAEIAMLLMNQTTVNLIVERSGEVGEA